MMSREKGGVQVRRTDGHCECTVRFSTAARRPMKEKVQCCAREWKGHVLHNHAVCVHDRCSCRKWAISHFQKSHVLHGGF